MTECAAMLMRRTGFGLLLLLAGCAGAENAAAPESTNTETAGLAGAAQFPAEEEAAPEPRIYPLGESGFRFPAGALLQTWPVIEAGPQLSFARLAVQMPAEQLTPELAGVKDTIQVDILQSATIPEGDAVLKAAFADWVGREEAPAQTAYKFTITSNRAATGRRLAYLRLDQHKIGLDSLSPFQPQAGAPIYLFALDGTQVTTLIECGPLPLGYHGVDHCSLRRRLGKDYGYRVLFPQDLLAFWQVIDDAARNYVGEARL